MSLKEYCKELETDIQNAYEQGVTMEQAERLAAKFLRAQMVISEALRDAALDARMRKSGVKAVRAALYLQEATKGDKKPSDVMLNAMVDMSDLVSGEQKSYDESEVNVEYLQNYLRVFDGAHVYFRAVMRGSFGG